MQGAIPILDFTGSGNYQLIYDSPFMEEFRDEKTGLYLIGIGCSPLSVQLNGKIRGKSHTFLATLMTEYEIYADQNSLDIPLLIEDQKGVLQTSGLMRDSYNIFNQIRIFFGYSHLSMKDRNLIVQKTLQNQINRQELGDLVIKELKSRNIPEESELHTILQQYKKRNGGKVIPLRNLSSEESTYFESNTCPNTSLG